MDPKEYERIKAEEKQHLLQIRALKQKLAEAERKKSIVNAVQGTALPDSVTATHEEMVERLNRESIRTEVKMEMALENAGLDAPTVAAPQINEEEAQKSRAADLIRQMKIEMGVGLPLDQPAATSSDMTGEGEKSIGRARAAEPAPEAGSKSEGERTLGRKRGI
ncbi:MAG: hypothetical protein J0L94_15385 [Rhodothermia bacterium]|nr:hypothetical protein [Rhodothermia bacterium]